MQLLFLKIVSNICLYLKQFVLWNDIIYRVIHAGTRIERKQGQKP